MAAPMASTFPVTTTQISVSVNSHHTDIICNKFEDKLFIIVTQLQKMGTMVHVMQENKFDAFKATTPFLSTKVLLGTDEPLTHVMAKNIVGDVLDDQRSIVLSMALKDTSSDCIQQLKTLVGKCVRGS